MPVEIFLSKANAEPEYETIDEADLKEDDEVVENDENQFDPLKRKKNHENKSHRHYCRSSSFS